MMWPGYKGHLFYSNTFVIYGLLVLSLGLVFLKEIQNFWFEEQQNGLVSWEWH